MIRTLGGRRATPKELRERERIKGLIADQLEAPARMSTPSRPVMGPRLPVERVTPPRAPVLAWFRCAGGCDRLVSAPACLCISCAAEDDT